jgi:hypothetical protein
VEKLAEKKGKTAALKGDELKDDITFEENVAPGKQKTVS